MVASSNGLDNAIGLVRAEAQKFTYIMKSFRHIKEQPNGFVIQGAMLHGST
jgi:hypothetical protein